jgi:serine protease inhibitor
MRHVSVERRLLLKTGLGALLGLASSAAFADILGNDAGDDAKRTGGDDLVAAQLRLGENLIRSLASHGRAAGANLIVSPASLAAILGFVDLGASRPLHSAIHRTLGFQRAARQQVDDDLKALRQGVSTILARGSDKSPFVLANLLVFDRSARPRQLALFALSGAGADVLVDNLGDAKIIDRINSWVRQKTHDLIPSILEEAPESLGLVAVNALYFKDKWQTPFDPARTARERFQQVAGDPVGVAMMHSPVAKFAFRQDDQFIAAELPYANEDFRLVVVTTKSAPAKPLDFAPVSGWLGGQGFQARSGEVGLPKFSLSAAEELLQPLDVLGLRAARRLPNALDGFSPEELVISRIVQKLELRLSEEATEAAAASAVVTTRSLALDPGLKMIVDKPFVFALRDRKSGLILFMGYVGSPPR